MSTVPAHQTAADLLSAANHIERFGWARGAFGAVGRRCCADGAIIAAVGIDTSAEHPNNLGDGYQADRAEAAEQALAAVLPVGGQGFAARTIWVWNDMFADEASVVAKFREAAEAVFPSV